MFEFKIPFGVSIYLWSVARDTVDSYRLRADAISRLVSGFNRLSPSVINSCCRITISVATRRIVASAVLAAAAILLEFVAIAL